MPAIPASGCVGCDERHRTASGDTVHRDQRLGRPAIADRIVDLVENGRGGQPLLFAGPAGSGKEVTALGIARRLNCRDPEHCDPGPGDGPRSCESCQKAASFQHPDIRWLGPAPASYEDSGSSGKVRELLEAKIADPFASPEFSATSQVLIGNPEQPGPLTVRGLMQFARRQAFQGRWKVAVVADAHRMNPAAANALLKTLEEPPPATLIILLSDRPSSLLPTILSRCQKVTFEPYSAPELAVVVEELRPESDPQARADAVRLAEGDARRALALLEPETQTLQAWAEATFLALGEGRAVAGHVAAEHLNGGILPRTDEKGDLDLKKGRVDDPPRRRRRALVFCETFALLTGEMIACREQGEAWRPRLRRSAERLRTLAAGRRTSSLLDDLARIERAKHEIDGNLNLGLVMAALCEEISNHVRRDQAAAAG